VEEGREKILELVSTPSRINLYMMRMIRYQGLIHSMKKMNSHQLIIDDNSNGGKLTIQKKEREKE
jgi:hypothetical protein